MKFIQKNTSKCFAGMKKSLTFAPAFRKNDSLETTVYKEFLSKKDKLIMIFSF